MVKKKYPLLDFFGGTFPTYEIRWLGTGGYAVYQFSLSALHYINKPSSRKS